LKSEHSCRSSAERSRLRYLESIKKKIKHEIESYLHKSFAEESIMMHEKIVFRDKQSVEAESSSRSMREVRRESVLSTNEIKDEFDAISTSYHIQNLDQLKY
jgi:hypothetical protein